MRHLIAAARLPLLAVAFAAGCSVSGLRGKGWGPAGPGDPGGVVGGHPATGPRVAGSSATMERVCRTGAVRRGWVATSYVAAGEECPRWRDAENPYNAAIIERLDGRPVGSRMTVCADQPVPRGWMREMVRDSRAQCPGARVSEGRPTTMVIRRER